MWMYKGKYSLLLKMSMTMTRTMTEFLSNYYTLFSRHHVS